MRPAPARQAIDSTLSWLFVVAVIVFVWPLVAAYYLSLKFGVPIAGAGWMKRTWARGSGG